MITANQKKFVTSLAQKKYRNQHKCFVVEGVKLVEELLDSNCKIHSIYALNNWAENHQHVDCEVVSIKELTSISSFKNPNEVLAVVHYQELSDLEFKNKLTIILDCIQDPGNLGTIIRTADWFGIDNIICSLDSADKYNPKVIQATMGSIFRLNIVYYDLQEFLAHNKDLIIYGAVLDGENIYNASLNIKGAALILGNESKGISEELKAFITNPVTIPKKGNAESLNVASAAAILCAEFSK